VSDNLSFTISGVRTDVVFSGSRRLPESDLTIFDANTAPLFDAVPDPLVLPAGEQAKEWESVRAILERCARLALGRDAVLCGVGGGVVCDITAFAASLYMRGCGLVLVPTTLLSMVDASLGGKTGIDFLGYKNMVGTFYPSGRIVIRADVVRTLPQREYLSGLAEVIKTALIGDRDLLVLLETRHDAVMAREPALVEEMIRRCLSVKGRLVEEDPKEGGARALLNLGHTFGHALETATGFTGWTHGEAVAWGIGRALEAGKRFGMTDPDFSERVTSLLASYGYRLRADLPYAALAPGFERDKKRKGGRTRLVIPCDVCDMRMVEASTEDLTAVIDAAGPGRGKERMKA
jgi:3-dehydroquinate synthase